MTTNDMQEKILALNVEHLTLKEMQIIAAIKSGKYTIKEISETIVLKSVLVQNICDSLEIKKRIKKDESGGYSIVGEVSKRFKFGGNLILPVSSFRDSSGQKWICRGNWYPIADDVDIVADIDWFDNTNSENMMQTIMQGVQEKKTKEKEEKAKTNINSDGRASIEDEKLSNKWNKISDHLRVYVWKISSSRALVSFSFNVINSGGFELPYGAITEKEIIDLPLLKALLSGDTSNFKPFDIETMKMVTPSSFPQAFDIDAEGNGTISFVRVEDIGNDKVRCEEKMYFDPQFSKKKLKVINGFDLTKDEFMKYFDIECQLTVQLIEAANLSINSK